MTKFTAVIKLAVLGALAAQLTFASDSQAGVHLASAEPLYLSLCGLILLTLGMLKGRRQES
ncbi:hypothetical protein [Agaribacterium haliotis]|uniref:hypothetical protein n=1 Tax=Agaribacterium haliotis TaxID=2013869 RepID=UPI000BB53167|nr:hypothetical protein [Agaribacterium haliotis]